LTLEPTNHLPRALASPRLALWLALCLLGGALALLAATMRGNVTRFYLAEQDVWVLGIGLTILAGASLNLKPRERPLDLTNRQLWLIGLLLVGLTFAGHWLVLWGHDLSRDEQMASFDAAVFASGRLFAELPELWHGRVSALNSLFMLKVPGDQAWISAYLPLNAAFRALCDVSFGSPWLAGPLFLAIGFAALWGCARRLWPDRRENAVIAVLLYSASSQVLLSAMSSYAMSGHLALNLVWLWLFLRRTLRGDLACLAVGLIATGLHQPLFHPLFALPILLTVVLERDWKRSALFLLGYGAIGAMWFAWPGAIAELTGGSAMDAGGEGRNGYLARLIGTLIDGSPNRFQLMSANLLRFLAWQPLLLGALMVLGTLLAWRDSIAIALIGGIALTVWAMLIMLPFQGHGFGYRYLHGLIGNAILVAIYGFNALNERAGRWRELLRRSLLVGTLVIMPLQMWMSYRSYAQQAIVSQDISAHDADYFVVGIWDAPYAINLVYNPPDLADRPVRLFADYLDQAAIAAICANGPSIALADRRLLAPIVAYSGSYNFPIEARNRDLGAKLSAAGCRVVL
jgi:hypothetical protein